MKLNQILTRILFWIYKKTNDQLILQFEDFKQSSAQKLKQTKKEFSTKQQNFLSENKRIQESDQIRTQELENQISNIENQKRILR